MKKNDIIAVGILVVLMFAWMNYYPALEKKFFPRPEQPVPAAEPAPAEEPLATAEARPEPVRQTEPAESVLRSAPETAGPVLQPDPVLPEQRLTLNNEEIELTVSSRGGSVVSAVLKNYPAENREDSGPVVLDFSTAPCLRYSGLSIQNGTIERQNGGLVYRADLGDNRQFRRTFRLGGDYQLHVEEEFINNGDRPWALPDMRLPTGPMSNPAGVSSMRGLSTLGVDTFAVAQGVEHWGKRLDKLFDDLPASADMIPAPPSALTSHPVDWVAAKNKFFVQILTPGTAASGFDIAARLKGEGTDTVPVEVAGALLFDAELIPEGGAAQRTARVYFGPKDFSVLKTQGMEQTGVMGFKSTGFWSFMNPVMYPIKRALLWGLKSLESVVRNYGLAIMLLTVIVRIIFWPITHKGTESMRRMQSLQPQLKEIREKYKDNPQRMQQETMAFYKEHKINPLGGCLPMLIQIPVFIALFTVLRSSIELRFSKFLWIRDLSEPERLFEGMIPLVGSLNILPLIMAGTMAWQQRLMPSGAGDAQQQKMMAVMMPVMMLFILYSMPSGLVLYWTTSQLLMIVQMLIKKKKEA